MLELSAGRHAAYCQKYGLTYWPVLGNVQFARTSHWNKIVLVRHALDLGFETVIWLDADTLIVRDDVDIRTALYGEKPLALALHPSPAPGGLLAHWNSGVMVMRNTARTREFFDAVWAGGPLENHIWQEQARILDLLPSFPDLVQRLDDRWNSTVGLTEVPDPIIKAWHGSGPAAAHSIFDELKRLGAVDARVAAAAEAFVHDGNAAEKARQFIATIPDYPNRFAGRGIVICAGGLGYFTCAWVAVHQLRRLGCTLPIQLWHLGPRELHKPLRELVAPLGVECIDGLEVRKSHPARILNGWELKPYAILHCPFREVLSLDSDNVPVVNPEFLFETERFRDTGAIFWPDYKRMAPERSAWNVFGVSFRDEPEFESGQVVVNKETCWRSLCLTMWYNDFSDFFYQHVHGDKDTFRFAWHRLGQPFAMPQFAIHTLESTMCQHDFDGHRIFQHRNCDKWNYRRENKRVTGFLFEDECRADVARLRALWDGTFGTTRDGNDGRRGQAEIPAKMPGVLSAE